MTTSSPCRTPSASSASRCSADCGIQPSSAATTSSTAGTGPDPGEHVGHEPLVPGHVDERDRRRRTAASVQANPRSMVMPAAPLLGPAVGLHPGQRPDQRRLAVVDVPGGGDDVHGQTRTAADAALQRSSSARRARAGRAGSGRARRGRAPAGSPARSAAAKPRAARPPRSAARRRARRRRRPRPRCRPPRRRRRPAQQRRQPRRPGRAAPPGRRARRRAHRRRRARAGSPPARPASACPPAAPGPAGAGAAARPASGPARRAAARPAGRRAACRRDAVTSAAPAAQRGGGVRLVGQQRVRREQPGADVDDDRHAEPGQLVDPDRAGEAA